jgi:hypothetical protein
VRVKLAADDCAARLHHAHDFADRRGYVDVMKNVDEHDNVESVIHQWLEQTKFKRPLEVATERRQLARADAHSALTSDRPGMDKTLADLEGLPNIPDGPERKVWCHQSPVPAL